MANRTPTPATNGVHKPNRGRKQTPAVVPPPAPDPAPRPDHLGRYAVAGVAVMATLSALLNGHANSQHSTIYWAGWAMGLVIPAVILLLAKVAGLLWKRGGKLRTLAYTTAGAGAGLLLLSVWHCATSISLLTGSPLLLAMPMAVAIDVGFVCSEISALVD